MDKKKSSNRFRHWFQAAWFALTNGYAKGFLEGKIYTGSTKTVCVPGLNCYSCPGAVGSCSIGSLQAVLDSQKFTFSCYIFGFLMAFGVLFGRLICGWMCPFGLVQDLLHKIPVFHKIKNLPGHKILKWLKYVILVVFVLLLPSIIVNIAGMGSPWFCEYICPSGTLFGGIPLVIMNKGLQQAVGFRFAWKVLLLLAIVILSVKAYRPFCKYLCPLGAIYGLFNPISFYRFKVDELKCIKCGACQKACGMDIKVWEKPNSMECIRCGNCKAVCPKGAITSTVEDLGKRFIAESPVGEQEPQKKILRGLGIGAVIFSIPSAYGVYLMFDSCPLYISLEPSFSTIGTAISWGILLMAVLLGIGIGACCIWSAIKGAKHNSILQLITMSRFLTVAALVVGVITYNWVYVIMMVLADIVWLLVLLIWKKLYLHVINKGRK